MDAREAKDYNARHIITARNAKMDSDGAFPLPVAVEVDSMQHVVVYDSNASCLQERGRAVKCAQVLAQASLSPVHVVRGGFQRFSALYPSLRTEKMMSTIMELENLKIYPVEIIAGLLYMGDQRQGLDSDILRDRKISAIIGVSQSDDLEFIKGNQTILNIPVADSAEAWRHMLKCKTNMRPNTGFLQQLPDWELHTVGTKVTDISGPHS